MHDFGVYTFQDVRKHLHQVRPTVVESAKPEIHFSPEQPGIPEDLDYEEEDYATYDMEEIDMTGLPEGIEEDDIEMEYDDCDCGLQDEVWVEK